MNTDYILLPDGYFSDEELVGIFRFIHRVERRPEWKDPCFLVRAILGLGCRIGELPQIHVQRDCKPNGIITIHETKTKKPRAVRCSPELLPYYLERVREREGYLFTRDPRKNYPGYGERINVRTLRRWWVDVITESGVRYLHPHAGRHTWATWELATKRLDIKEVQAQLGHSKIEMTLQIYTHASVETRYEEDKTPEWWGEALKGITEIEKKRPLSIVA